jgi:hypothetical protein
VVGTVGPLGEHHRRRGEEDRQAALGRSLGQEPGPQLGAERQVADRIRTHRVEEAPAGGRVVRRDLRAIPRHHLVARGARVLGQPRCDRAPHPGEQHSHGAGR